MQSLDDVLNDSDQQVEGAGYADGQQAQESEAKPQGTTFEETTGEGSKGDETQGEESQISDASDEEKASDEKRETPERETEEKDWTFAAYRDEKRKRQELEKKIEELTKSEAKPEKVPDILDDPDGFHEYQQTQVDQKVNNVKAQMSQFYAEKEFGKEKVQTAFDKFSEMVKDNPNLYTQVINEVSPYHAIVELVDKASKFEQMQNIDDYESKLRAEIEQKVRAEMQKEFSEKSAKKSVTPSLNTLTQAEGDTVEVGQSLGDILGR